MPGRNNESHPSPTVQFVTQVLEERIYTGVYSGGQRLPTERALADEFRVSRILIRQAIDAMEHSGLLQRSARCRPVIRDGQAGTTVAPSAVEPRNSIAVWVWPSLSNPVSAMIIRGIRQALSPDSHRLILESAVGTTDAEVYLAEEAFLRRCVNDRDIAGAIIYFLGGERNLPALHALRAAGIPMVFIDRLPPQGFPADYVGVDNVRGAESAVRYLLSLGHTRIIHVTNSESVSTVAERMKGYYRTLERAGITVRPEWIIRDLGANLDDPNYGQRHVVESVLKLLESPDPPTAVFTINDFEAFWLMEGLRDHKVRVPEDLSIIGFDGMERWRPGRPFLSTVWQPVERMGECAVERLLERIADGPDTPFRHQMLDTTLVAAETTAPIGEAIRHQKNNEVGAVTID